MPANSAAVKKEPAFLLNWLLNACSTKPLKNISSTKGASITITTKARARSRCESPKYGK